MLDWAQDALNGGRRVGREGATGAGHGAPPAPPPRLLPRAHRRAPPPAHPQLCPIGTGAFSLLLNEARLEDAIELDYAFAGGRCRGARPCLCCRGGFFWGGGAHGREGGGLM